MHGSAKDSLTANADIATSLMVFNGGEPEGLGCSRGCLETPVMVASRLADHRRVFEYRRVPHQFHGERRMRESNEVREQQSLARRIAQSMPVEEKERFRVWVAKLLEIRGGNGSALFKAKQAVKATVSDGVAVAIARLLATELKRLGWNERGLKWRVGFIAAVITAVVTGGQGAGIAALGGAIGVPLWLVLGAGGAFLAMLYEELGTGAGPVRPEQPATGTSPGRTSEAPARNPGPEGSPFIVDVIAKDVPSGPAEARADPALMALAPRLWVGELEGSALIFDPAIQLKDGPHVFLWNSGTGLMEKFVPAILRTLVRRYRGPVPLEELHRRYTEWLKGEGENWLAAEAPYYQQRLAKELASASKRQEPWRAAHCYQCKEPLAGNVDAPCPKCGWMVCANCEACGCSYAA
jgi:hypothetical protein